MLYNYSQTKKTPKNTENRNDTSDSFIIIVHLNLK